MAIRRVTVQGAQRGWYCEGRELVTHWPQELLDALSALKGEWFLDSYQRFEHPNYIQKQIDFVLDLYDMSLGDGPILDFGCGFGASSYCLLKRGATEIVATDLEPANTQFASRFFATMGMSARIDVRCGDILPSLAPGSFAVIWLQAVVEHLLPEERTAYLRRFWEVLRPGGVLVITETPNRLWPVEGHTTRGTWWIPWMKPQTVFSRMSKRPRYASFSDQDFYRSGIIGSSYREILDCLGRPDDCVEMSLGVRGYMRRLYARAARRSFTRWLATSAVGLVEPVARNVLHRPITAFMPFLNHLAFRKKSEGLL
jgi:2-polyprenyl-3-methyl-5-hydroxy-6-metoxy-1,4-benzoquinol methylase